METEKDRQSHPEKKLSPLLKCLLKKEASNAEVQAGLDAAVEEGIPMTKEEAEEILRKNPHGNPRSTAQDPR